MCLCSVDRSGCACGAERARLVARARHSACCRPGGDESRMQLGFNGGGRMMWTLTRPWSRRSRGAGSAPARSREARASRKWAARLALISSASVLSACQLAADRAFAPPQADDVLSLTEGAQAVDTTASLPAVDAPAGCLEPPCCTLQPDATEDALQRSLGCGPSYMYLEHLDSGAGSTPLGVGSFCPDTPTSRIILHNRGKRGYFAGYCDTCLCVPAGQIFVFWRIEVGPTCPSGCQNRLPPQL